jgi:invasion protein IalB
MTGFPRAIVTLVVAILIFVAGAVVGWVGGRAHPALADVPTVAMYDGWRLACPAASHKDVPCAISNDLVETKTGKRVAQLTLVHAKERVVLVVTVPFDVLLTSGVGLDLGDGKPRAYHYLTCNSAGCIAQIPVDANMQAQMRQGQRGKLLLGSLDRKTVAIVFSLTGFAAADDALAARRHSHSFLGMAI